MLVYSPGHPRPNLKPNHVFEYVLIAEKALGKYLPPAAVIHHVNGDPTDNRKNNLVICQDHAYHALIHARMRKRDERGRWMRRENGWRR